MLLQQKFLWVIQALSPSGSLAAIAIIVKHEIVLAIIGGLFVLETVSVIIQVASFKLTGRRIFKMAPYHHFEKRVGLVHNCYSFLDNCNHIGISWFSNVEIKVKHAQILNLENCRSLFMDLVYLGVQLLNFLKK